VQADDLTAVLATVDRFCREVIDPRVGRPELVLPAAELTRIGDEARQCGILPLAGEPGLGLWEDGRRPEGLQRSLASLARLAESGAGVAFHLHQVALATLVARELGSGPAGGPVLLPSGLARGVLAEVLAGRAPGPGGDALLRDTLPGQAGEVGPCFLHAAEPWSEIITPAWNDAALAWLRLPRERLDVAGAVGQHGLDEVPLWAVRFPEGGVGRALCSGALARRLLATALGLSALGLVAIGLGAVRHGLRLARAHAATRRQGGALLREHPAVQDLLGQAEAIAATVASALRGAGAVPETAEGLAPVLGLRAVIHPLLCRAANLSLQVLGGTGYMRDAGAEKVVRDANHLWLLGGGGGAAWRFLAGAEDQP